mgnify:FL=1
MARKRKRKSVVEEDIFNALKELNCEYLEDDLRKCLDALNEKSSANKKRKLSDVSIEKEPKKVEEIENRDENAATE